MNYIAELRKHNRRNTMTIIAMLVAVAAVGVACLFVGSSNMTFYDALDALYPLVYENPDIRVYQVNQ